MKIKSIGKRYSSILMVICLVASNCIQVSANDLVEYNYTSTQINETVAEDSKQTDELGEAAVDDSNQTEKTNETATEDNEQTEETNETATEVNEQTEEMTETVTEDNNQTEKPSETATTDSDKIEEVEKIEVPEEIETENKELENIVVPSVEIKEEQTLAIPQNLKASFEDGKLKIEWDIVEGAIGYDLLINDTIISDVEESPYYYCDISDETEYSAKVRAKFSVEEKAISTYLETKQVEMSNETASVNSLTDSIENEFLSEWSSAVLVSAVASKGTKVSGNIAADTYWSAQNSPYIVTGKIEIAQGATLTIGAGTVITMNKSTVSSGEIVIKGKLYASGTGGRTIVFTSINDPDYGGTSPTEWTGLSVYTGGELDLNNVEIRYAGSNAISTSGILNISNSTICNAKGNGISIGTRAVNVSVINNRILDNGGSGVYINSVNGGDFSFYKNTISNSGKESIAINLTGYKPTNEVSVFQNNSIDGRIKISGTLQQDLTFNKNIYNLVGELIVPAGKTLTIEPGAIINQTAAKSTAITVEGKLDATGTVSNPIIFTNYSDPMFEGTGGIFWDGFSVKSLGELKLDCTEIRYTGSNAISNSGNLELKNSKIENAKGVGVFNSTKGKNVVIENNEILETGKVAVNINSFNGGSFSFSNNTISSSIKEGMTISLTNYKPDAEIGGIESNQLNGAINIFGILQRDFVLPKRTYNISGDLTIPEGINLKIEAGSILNEKVAATSQIAVAGNLEAIGTSNNPIIFTNNSDPLVGQAQQFYWKGISVKSGGKLVLEYGEIRYAGSSGISSSGSLDITNSKITNTQSNGIWLSCNSKDIRIENNEISKCGSSGIFISSVRGCNLIFQKNVIKECTEGSLTLGLSNFKPAVLTGGLEFNTLEAIKIDGILQQDLELPKNTYVISSNLSIPSGITLTIDAGSIIKVKAIAGESVKIEGTLNANGTLKEPIVFTSIEDPQYGGVKKLTYWGYFTVASKGIFKLDYTQIKYSGLGLKNAASDTINCSGTLRMNNSTIANSNGNGITFSTLIQPLLKNNSFINNVNYSVKNSRVSAITIDATNNYWGSAAGPALYDTTTKTWSTDGGKISGGVDYIPYYKEPTFSESNEDAATVNIDCIDYLTAPLESCQDETLRVTVSNNTSEAKDCYVQVLCSWDNETWYKRGTKNISLSAREQNHNVDFEYCIFLNGNLYTKAVLFDSSDDSQLGEYIKSNADPVRVGIIENYDWYKFSESDGLGVTVEGYISEIGGYAGEATEIVYAIAKRSDEEIWRQYGLNAGEWSATQVTYLVDPIKSNGTMSLSKMSPLSMKAEYATSDFSIPSIKDVEQAIENKKKELFEMFCSKIGIDPTELSDEDIQMILGGLASSTDDNVFFGVAKSVAGFEDNEDNYYYMKAKAFGDSVFVAAFYTATAGTAAEALRAINTAGASGAMAIATSPTGAGTVAFGSAAVAELAEAAAMSGISFISGKMAERSTGIMKDSVAKLKETAGYIYREAKEQINNTLKKISVTNKVEKTTEGINAWWRNKGYNDPYKPNTPVYEITLSEDTMFVRVYPEGGNMAGGWVMKAEEIQGLTPNQIQNKFALPQVPKYVCDVNIPATTTIRCGIVGPQTEYGGLGGGVQFDLMQQMVGEFTNSRLLP